MCDDERYEDEISLLCQSCGQVVTVEVSEAMVDCPQCGWESMLDDPVIEDAIEEYEKWIDAQWDNYY